MHASQDKGSCESKVLAQDSSSSIIFSAVFSVDFKASKLRPIRNNCLDF